MAKTPATVRFAEAARTVGHDPRIERFPADTRTAEQAAAALGCVVDQIVKSLVFRVEEAPLLVLTSGANRVHTERLTVWVGRPLGRADASLVRDATGFAIGGVPPFGHARRLRTVIDPHLLTLETVWGAAGAPDSVFPISPLELARITDADVVDCFEPLG